LAAPYCTVILSDPLAQVLPDKTDALMVAVPAATKVASPIVVVEKVTTEVSLDVQVAVLVTSTLLSVAVNGWLVPCVKVVVLAGPIVSVWPPVPPVEVPVIDPLTPPNVAVIVTFVAAPAPTTNPDEFTVTQALELPQVAELVTSFVLLV
jgi:hypothetical protein